MNNQLFSLFVLISFFYFAIAMEGVVIYDKLYSVNVLINVLSYLEDNNVDFDRVWLRIWLHDGKNYQGWSKNKTRNVEIIEKLANTLKEKDRKYGIFTRIDYWLEITENTSKFSDAPLLYYHEDFKNNFDDYYSSGYAFGGWKDPEMKVYGNTKNICGANVYPVWLP
uniref:DUF1566 domain-containing protein n=1 Tax=Meloidogyne hapla TaxID=6305 RepID=A0A1I8B3H5_MELHA